MPDYIKHIFAFTFLAIFIATAVITLLVLIDRVKIQDRFRSRLFSFLILQVVGCVILFAKQAFASPTQAETREQYLKLLTETEWTSHYSPLNWFTKGKFLRQGEDKLQFIATTYVKNVRKNAQEDFLIFKFTGEPIALPSSDSELQIAGSLHVYKEIKDALGEMSLQPGDYKTV